MPDLVRIPDVPLCATGTYQLSTGQATFAEEDLIAAVAALDDPAVHVPRIIIDGLADSFAPDAHGGEPAFGYVDAMRVSDDGQTLVGDFMVPDWLAESIEWAYPSRSIEGGQGWRSPTGRTHDLVITGVALLGVDQPGVSVLPDLRELLSGAPADEPRKVLARMPRRAGRIAAGLDQDLVRRRFYEWLESDDVDLPDGTSAWSFWIRSLRFDDNGVAYLKVDDEENGRLYRVDFTVSRSQVSFDGWTEVVEQDVAVTASTRRPAPALAVWATREQSREGLTIKAAVRPNDQEETAVMDVDTTLLRRKLGLPEDATEDQITEALAAEENTPAPEGDGDEGDEPDNEGAPAGGEQSADPIAAAATRQIRDLSGEVADLKAREAARVARETVERQHGKVEASITDARITPADRDYFRRLMEIDEDGTTAILNARAPGSAMPLDPRSSGAEPVADEQHDHLVNEDGTLAASVSLLTSSQRRHAATR